MRSVEIVIESFKYIKTIIKTNDSQIETHTVQERPKIEIQKADTTSTNLMYISGMEIPKQLATSMSQPININYFIGMDLNAYNIPPEQCKGASTLSNPESLYENKIYGNNEKQERLKQLFKLSYQNNSDTKISESYCCGK